MRFGCGIVAQIKVGHVEALIHWLFGRNGVVPACVDLAASIIVAADDGLAPGTATFAMFDKHLDLSNCQMQIIGFEHVCSGVEACIKFVDP